MSGADRKRRATWVRFLMAAGLLLAIFHIIFCNEAQLHLVGQPRGWSDLTVWEQRRLAWSRGPVELWRTFSRLSTGSLLAAVFWCGIPVWMGGLRWHAALRVQGLKLPLGELLRISFVAHFFNAFLLGSTGGDVVRAWYASRIRPTERAEAALTVLVDRLIGTVSLLAFAVIMIPMAWAVSTPDGVVELFREYRRYLAVALLLGGMLLVAGVAVGIGFFSNWFRDESFAGRLLRRLPHGASATRALASCRLFGRSPGYLVRASVYSIGINLSMVATFLALAHGLELEVPDRVLWFVIPAVVCLAALPITPSGLGVREHLFVALLALPVFPEVRHGEALSLALLGYITNLAWSAVGGVVYLCWPNRLDIRP